jgi:hypothetical protein
MDGRGIKAEPHKDNEAPQRLLTFLAWGNVGVHLLGLVLAGLGMRQGTLTVPLADRMAYLASDPLGWSLGWSVWMCCTLSLIAFLAVLAQRFPAQAGLSQLAVTLSVVGGAFDLFCDSAYLVVFPWIASLQPPAEIIFLTFEKLIAIGSLVVANGLYSISILLMTLALRGRHTLARGTVATGYGVCAFGLLLAAAGFTRNPWHVAATTGPTIGLYCLWTLLVARSFAPTKGRP